ncbi:MAG: hypothetical protein DMF69_15250, partial [Acidobacteria bacterium]
MESKSASSKPFKIGGEKRLREYLRDQEINLQSRIDRETDEYISRVDEAEFIELIVNEFSLAIPQLDFDNVTASTGKTLVPAERFPPNQFDV